MGMEAIGILFPSLFISSNVLVILLNSAYPIIGSLKSKSIVPGALLL